MNAQEILSLYQSMMKSMGKALDAAHAQNWEHFTMLTEQVGEHTALLEAAEPGLFMTPEEIGQKKSMIERMLADDREIKKLVAGRMAVLATLVNGTTTGEKIANIYGNTL